MEALSLFLAGPIGQIATLAGGVALGWWAKKHPPATPVVAPAPPKLADVVPETHVPVLQKLLADPALMEMLQLLLERLTQQKIVAAHDALASLAVPVALPVATVLTASK